MFKKQLIDQHSSFLNNLKDRSLDKLREKALSHFSQIGFPDKNSEEYKYTSFLEITDKEFNIYPKKEIDFFVNNLEDLYLDTVTKYCLTFINGEFRTEYSKIPSEIVFMPFDKAKEDKKTADLFSFYFNKIASEKNPFVNLNTAYFQNGYSLFIPQNTLLTEPIQIIYISIGQDNNTFYPLRNLVVVEKSAQVEVIESHHNFDNTFVFTDVVTEVLVSANAHFSWDKLQNDKQTSYLVDNTYIEQEMDSVAMVNTFSFGGRLTRNNLQMKHKGENINSFMNGITVINSDQIVDHHTMVFHNKPHCESFQNYKGVYDERAHGVFNGSVYVHKEAQKTNAFQQNNNILLSEEAIIDSKPQLEIFADDVKCSHGCTVGQLDKDSLFYLRTRSIPEKEAKKILVQAFACETLDSITYMPLKNKINSLIHEKLDQ